MAGNPTNPTQSPFRLDLEPAELKIVHTALKTLYDGLGHEETDVERVVKAVLAKLPAEDEIAEIDLDLAR